MPQCNPKPGELYRHFKNKMYQIIGIVTHSETREKMVCYQALYGDFGMYVRPYDMFISEVDHVKYPEVTQKYRFELVGAAGNSNDDTVVGSAGNSNDDTVVVSVGNSNVDTVVVSVGNSNVDTVVGSAGNNNFDTVVGSTGNPVLDETMVSEETVSGNLNTEMSPKRADSMETLLAFLDAEHIEDKLEILNDIEEKDVTDSLIDSMAVSIDLVIPDGKISERFDQLKYALRTRARYEAEGLSSRFRVKVRK